MLHKSNEKNNDTEIEAVSASIDARKDSIEK